MEEPMKTPNTQENKKMVVKIGAGGGGGGLGAVVLLGGVLATAAFASALVFRGKGKDHRRRHQNPPRENPSKGAVKEVENDDDGDFQVSNESLKLDEKDRCETNSSDEILCSINPRNLEKDDGLIIVNHKESPFLEEKSPPELQNTLPEDGEIVVEKCAEVIQGAEMDLSEDCSNQEAMSAVDSLREFTVSKSHSEDWGKTLQPVLESPVIEHENVDRDEKEDEGTREDRVEPYEVKFIEEQCDQRNNHLIDLIEEKDGNVFIPFEKKEENVGATHPTEEILAGMVSEDVEVKNEEVANENIKKGVEEELITHEKDETARDDILGEEEGGESDAQLRNLNGEREENISIPYEKKEENECITNPTEDILAVIVEGVSEVTEKGVAEENVKKGVEEELISPQDTEISKDGANEVVLDSLELVENGTPIEFPVIQPKDQSHEIKENTKNGVVEEFIFHENVEAVEDDVAEDEIKDFIHEDVSSDETVEDSSVEIGDSSNESNSEVIWPAESLDFQKAKHISHEVEKKIQEDKTVEGDENHQTIVHESSVEPHKSRAEEDDRELPGGNGDSEEDYIKKLVVEMGMMKDHPTNPTQRRVMIGALSLLSSLSCSWLLGLSFVKLCLIVFLTMAMWEIHG